MLTLSRASRIERWGDDAPCCSDVLSQPDLVHSELNELCFSGGGRTGSFTDQAAGVGAPAAAPPAEASPAGPP